jgi:glycosyltransferase involved in cell wall biosynthesis
MRSSEIAFVVPAYNENIVLEQTLLPLLAIGEVVVVDDGSALPISLSEPTLDQIHYLRHLINRGQGASLETGFSYIRENMHQVKYVITFDADGQHNAQDIAGMIEIARNGYEVVLGSRFLTTTNRIPFLKRVILRTFAAIYSVINRKKITDRHFGLRILSRNFLEHNSLVMSGYEHADEIVDLALKGNWKYCEYPCTVNYTEYSQSKGQPVVNGLNILFNRMLSKL